MIVPVDFPAVQKALYNWFANSTELPVDWAFQKKSQRSAPNGFGVLQILSVAMLPDLTEDELRTTDINGNSDPAAIAAAAELYKTWVGTRRLIVNCQVVRKPSTAGADQSFSTHAFNYLLAAQSTARGSEDLEAGNLTFVSVSPLTNLSAVAAEGFESRASMDVTFDVQSIFTETVPSGWFNQAVINGEQIGPP